LHAMSEPRRIYLDHHATTPTDPRVAAVVLRYLTESFGNAHSSDHDFGAEAEAAVENARAEVARLVGASPQSVIFTSGATEALNLAIQGWVRERAIGRRTMHVLLTSVEHKVVLETCKGLQAQGLVTLDFLPVDEFGRLDMTSFEESCRRGADLACVMAAQNEIGNIYPTAEIARIAERHGVALLCDATQAAGRLPMAAEEWGLSLTVLSSHKLYGPKGVGALVLRRGVRVRPLFFGGDQERSLRPGTLDVPGIAGFGEACRLRRTEMAVDEPAIESKRNRLWSRLAAGIPGIRKNGDPQARLAGNLHVSLIGIPNSAVVARLAGTVALSTGSACSSGTLAPSHVLRAMRLPEERVAGALRFGIGKFTTDDDVELAAELVVKAALDVKAAVQS
jgi:cysteine desulfurase